MRVLFVGDVVGSPGRKKLKEVFPELKKEIQFDFCIVNAENSAGGRGLTYMVAQEFFKMGIDLLTLGNHTWSKREIENFLDSDSRIIRPANYHPDLPGKGSSVISGAKGKIGVVNVLGRVYMDMVDCPFRAVEREIEYLKEFVKIIIVDCHAEATSEKIAMAWLLDGRVSLVVGTHTHVQTADERILPCGTGFISDVGMTGPSEGVLGVDKDIVINRFITNLPVKFEVAQGRTQLNAIVADIDEKTGRTMRIERINRGYH